MRRGGNAIKGAIIYTWRNTIRGREKEALGVFGQALAHAEGQQKKGCLREQHRLLRPLGQCLGLLGIQVITGAAPALRQASLEPDSMKLDQLAANVVENFTVIECLGGDEATIQELMSVAVGAEQELGLM